MFAIALGMERSPTDHWQWIGERGQGQEGLGQASTDAGPAPRVEGRAGVRPGPYDRPGRTLSDLVYPEPSLDQMDLLYPQTQQAAAAHEQRQRALANRVRELQQQNEHARQEQQRARQELQELEAELVRKTEELEALEWEKARLEVARREAVDPYEWQEIVPHRPVEHDFSRVRYRHGGQGRATPEPGRAQSSEASMEVEEPRVGAEGGVVPEREA